MRKRILAKYLKKDNDENVTKWQQNNEHEKIWQNKKKDEKKREKEEIKKENEKIL